MMAFRHKMALRTHIKSEREVTVDELVQMGDAIWQLVKSTRLDKGDHAGQDQLMMRIQRDNPQFCTSYPIVVKYACYMRAYDSKTFRLWLDRIKRNPWKDEASYLDAMADYATSLAMTRGRHKGTHLNASDRARYRTNIRAVLQAEHDEIKKCSADAEAEVTAEIDRRAAENRQQLAEFTRAIGPVGMKPAGTYRVEADDLPARSARIDIEQTLAPLGEEYDL